MPGCHRRSRTVQRVLYRHDYLNGPKVLCGQQPIAPCSAALNNGFVAAPSSECAYFNTYVGVPVTIDALRYLTAKPRVLLPSLLPSLSASCLTVLATGGFGNNTCIPECQSLYDLVGRCYGEATADALATGLCGMYNNQNCSFIFSALDNKAAEYLVGFIFLGCYNSTYCAPICRAFISLVEQNAGCCSAILMNGASVVCGQQPIPFCPTVVRGNGSVTSTTKFTLSLMTFMIGIYIVII